MGFGMLLSGVALVLSVGIAMWNARKRGRLQKPSRTRTDYWKRCKL